MEYLELARAGRFSQGNLAERLVALSAAKLLIYGLEKAGREVTRDKIIETLEKLYHFDTGQTPPLTFSPNRRVGALGAHIIGIDLEKKQLLLTFHMDRAGIALVLCEDGGSIKGQSRSAPVGMRSRASDAARLDASFCYFCHARRRCKRSGSLLIFEIPSKSHVSPIYLHRGGYDRWLSQALFLRRS